MTTSSEPTVWIAMRPWQPERDQLAEAGAARSDRLHLTLAFLGSRDALPDDVGARCLRAMRRTVGPGTPWPSPLGASVTRFRHFRTPSGPLHYAAVERGPIRPLRAALVRELAVEGLEPDATHAFLPHVTLGAHAPRPSPRPYLLTFSSLHLHVGDRIHVVRFDGSRGFPTRATDR